MAIANQWFIGHSSIVNGEGVDVFECGWLSTVIIKKLGVRRGD